MSAPAYVIAPAPKATRYASLEYQCAVNGALLATTRPPGRSPHMGLLSASEMDEMDVAYRAGLSAAEFAARLIARDTVRAAPEARP